MTQPEKSSFLPTLNSGTEAGVALSALLLAGGRGPWQPPSIPHRCPGYSGNTGLLADRPGLPSCLLHTDLGQDPRGREAAAREGTWAQGRIGPVEGGLGDR